MNLCWFNGLTQNECFQYFSISITIVYPIQKVSIPFNDGSWTSCEEVRNL